MNKSSKGRGGNTSVIPSRYHMEEPKTRESVTYSVPKGRVRRLIGRLAKTDVVPLNDSKFITRLKTSLDTEYDEECKGRMNNREKLEISRIRKLCINGEMEPPEELVEDLKTNSAYRINRMISNIKEKVLKTEGEGFSKRDCRPLTPVEPFADEYKNYFLKSHLYGSVSVDPSRVENYLAHMDDIHITSSDTSVVEEVHPIIITDSRQGTKPSSDDDSITTLKIKKKSHGKKKKGVKFTPSVVEFDEPSEDEGEEILPEPSTTTEVSEKNDTSSPVVNEGTEVDMMSPTNEDLKPFKPFVSELIDDVNTVEEPQEMFEVGTNILKTFVRQGRAADQLLKKKPPRQE